MLNNVEWIHLLFHFGYDHLNPNAQFTSPRHPHALHTYSILYLLPTHPFLKHSSDHISLIKIRQEKKKTVKTARVLVIGMKGVPFLELSRRLHWIRDMNKDLKRLEIKPCGYLGWRALTAKILKQEHACYLWETARKLVELEHSEQEKIIADEVGIPSHVEPYRSLKEFWMEMKY